MTNVVVARPRRVRITANATAGVIETIVPVTLKNAPITSGSNRLDKLYDVDPTGETAGAVPVYDTISDKYIVKKLDLADVVGDLDGGIF